MSVTHVKTEAMNSHTAASASSGSTRAASMPARALADGNRQTFDNSAGFFGVVATLFIALHVATKPLYLYSSGLPQISDGIIVIMFLTLLISGSISGTNLSIAAPFCTFAVYAASINLFWYANYQNAKIIESAAYYLFNALVFVTFYCALLRAGPGNIRKLAYVVVGLILIYFLLSFVVAGSHPFRGTLFFNNPNQLAYFLILVSCMVGVIYTSIGLPSYLVLFLYSISAYLMLTTISRAGIACFALIAIITFYNKATPVIIMGLLAVAVLAGGFPSILEDRYSGISERYDRRFDQLDEGEGANSIYGRGYDYIFSYPQYLLFGAGEGVEKRLGYKHEPHSSWVVLIFCYGIIGSGIFFYGCWRLFDRAGFSIFFYLAPPAVYGAAHQGLRFTTLWVLFAFIAYAGYLRQRQHANGRPGRYHRHRHLVPPARQSLGGD